MPARPSFRTRRFRRTTLLTALLSVPLLLLSACAGSGSAASTAGGPATLKWATSYFPAHWDPVVSGSGAQFRELALVYASLTRTDAEGTTSTPPDRLNRTTRLTAPDGNAWLMSGCSNFCDGASGRPGRYVVKCTRAGDFPVIRAARETVHTAAPA